MRHAVSFFMVSMVLAAMLCGAMDATAQTLVRDTVSGDYILRFTWNDSVQVEARIEAADQVEPTLDAIVDSSGRAWAYRYVVQNAASAKRAIAYLQFPCPPQDSLRRFEVPRRRVGRSHTDGTTFVCEFVIASTEEDEIRPGDSVGGLVAFSAYLPGIVEARVYAVVQSPNFGRVEIHEDVPWLPQVEELIERAQGVDYETGGGKRLSVVAPLRSATALKDPAAVALIEADRAASCERLQWISDQAVCSTLATQLAVARRAVQNGNRTAAASALDRFLAVLTAHRGRAVNNSAYSLLATNAGFVRTHISAQ
jgi:hypothetical protein